MKDEGRVADQQVGYRKPPVEHRFQKGRSGNPKGRPRKPAQPKLARGELQGANELAKDWILEEAYRLVAIKEGDRVVRLPVIQAVFRSMGVSALKGNRFAQQTLAELVQKVEEERRELQFEMFKALVEYKLSAEAEIERCTRLGIPVPEMVPHPEDIVVDPRRGVGYFKGAITDEEKATVAGAIAFRDDLIEETAWLRRDLARNPGSKTIQNLIDGNLRYIERMNAVLPDRHRREMNDSYDLKGRRKRTKKSASRAVL